VIGVRQSDPAVLSELLDEELASDPTTSRQLTNHLPMALVAKAGLGADNEELRRFTTRYAKRNVPLAPVQHHLDSSSWQSAVGQLGASGDLREYFVERVRDDGVAETVRTHLPALLPGIAGAAFHGVIRLAYALEVDSPPRVAAGLAYLAEVAAPLGPVRPGSATSDDPVELIVTFATSQPWSREFKNENIGERMSAVAQGEAFQSLASSLELNAESEHRLADAALRIFAATGDFTALHGVTGMSAISSIRTWSDDPALVDRYAFQALAAAYLTIGAPDLWSGDRLEQFVASNETTPEETERVGAYSDDEHVAKLIYTAHQRWSRTRDPLYLAVAAREGGLMAPAGS
jgi:hypothetical protein